MMMKTQLTASCNDKAFLACVGISKSKCASTTTRAMSRCETLFPKSMNAVSETAMDAYGDCVSKNLLNNAGITANKLDNCMPTDSVASMTDAQILDQVNRSMKLYAEAAGTGNVLSGRPFVGSNNFDRPQVIKYYAELAYHIANNVSAHYRSPGGGFGRDCSLPGKMTSYESGRTVTNIYTNCRDSRFELPVTNGVLIGRKINDNVTVTQIKNLIMSFEVSKTGYTIEGKVKATDSTNGITTITNIGDISFTYNLRNETWQHFVTSLDYAKIYPGNPEIQTEEVFRIRLSGKLYNSISAETIEPIKMGTGNNFKEIVSGKFKISKGNKSAVITFITPREILIERTGKKPVKTDWYGDPTRIYSEIPLALKY